MDDEKRTTPLGLWRYSKDYLDAANTLCEPEDSIVYEMRQRFSEPVFYLIGHSIELSLKGFLRGRGIPLKDLRIKYGHDLEKLLDEARRRKLGLEVKLKERDLVAISLLNQTYKRKELEYIVSGSKTVPGHFSIANAAGKLVIGLKGYCYKMTSNQSLKHGPRKQRAAT